MTPSATNLDLLAVENRLREAGCVFAEDEARLLISAADTPAELVAMVDLRADGLPLEQVIGWTEFCDIRIELDRGVFVPRYRTEFLVHQAHDLVSPGDVVVDLCCGSGAIGLALAISRGVDLHAVDIDATAVKCARRNLEPIGGRVYQGDLYDGLPGALRERVDLVVANAPYVPTGAMETLPREARVYEPLVALDGGVDGLDIQRRIMTDAAQWLTDGGHLLMETSEEQATRTVNIVAGGGLDARILRSEDLDATVVIGERRCPSKR